MSSENFFSDNQDLLFHLNKTVNFKDIFKLLTDEEKDVVNAKDYKEYKENWIEVLTSLGEICSKTIAKNAKQVEKDGLELKNGEVIFPQALQENIQTLVDFGIPGIIIDPKFGGMGAPIVVGMAGAEMINRACPSTLLNVSWYGAIAQIIDEFGSDEIKNEYIPRIATGELSGNMALTEPDIGSDLAAIKSYAEKQDDGSYHLNGQKRFITNGNGEVSLVLAQTEKGLVGLNSLSLFLCPRKIDHKDNIRIEKLEEKMALHGSATCELLYNNSKAYILGEEGKGYKYMLRLMNDSRLGVGFQGLGVMEASNRLAQDYAQERKTWGKPIAQHELIAEKLLKLDSELLATRSLGFAAAQGRTLMVLVERKLEQNDGLSSDEKKRLKHQLHDYQAYVRMLTPLLKYWVGEKSTEYAREALNIFGGYGFTTEYEPERWLRESVILSLYEGTSQIQALMCMKDTIKVIMKKPKLFFENLLGLSYRRYVERDPLKRNLYNIKYYVQNTILSILIKVIKSNLRLSLSQTSKTDFIKITKILKSDFIKFEDFSSALLHSERLCLMKAYEQMSECMIADLSRDPGRLAVTQRFVHDAYHQAKFLQRQVLHEDPVILEQLKQYKKGEAGIYYRQVEDMQEAAH